MSSDTRCTFRDSEYLTFTASVDVLGVSADRAHVHRPFIEQHDLEVPVTERQQQPPQRTTEPAPGSDGPRTGSASERLWTYKM